MQNIPHQGVLMEGFKYSPEALWGDTCGLVPSQIDPLRLSIKELPVFFMGKVTKPRASINPRAGDYFSWHEKLAGLG